MERIEKSGLDKMAVILDDIFKYIFLNEKYWFFIPI